MNDYMRQSLNLSAMHGVEFCGVRVVFDDDVSLCRFEPLKGDRIPFNADTYAYPKKGIRKGKAVSIRLALFPDGEGNIFHDEAEYNLKKKNRMAAESMIPCGAFSVPSNAEDFRESARIIMNGKVVSVEKVVLDKIESLHIGLQCLGVVYDFFIDDGVLPFCSVGNILSTTGYAICRVEKSS